MGWSQAGQPAQTTYSTQTTRPAQPVRPTQPGRSVQSAQATRQMVQPTAPAAENQEEISAASNPIQESPIYSSEIGHEAVEIHLNREDILKGIIYSELLAPPKSKRMGR